MNHMSLHPACITKPGAHNVAIGVQSPGGGGWRLPFDRRLRDLSTSTLHHHLALSTYCHGSSSLVPLRHVRDSTPPCFVVRLLLADALPVRLGHPSDLSTAETSARRQDRRGKGLDSERIGRARVRSCIRARRRGLTTETAARDTWLIPRCLLLVRMAGLIRSL